MNVTAPAHGTLTGTAPNLTYTPAASYVGLDRFTFQVPDSLTNSAPGTVSLIVGMAAGTGLKGEYYDNAGFHRPEIHAHRPAGQFRLGHRFAEQLDGGRYFQRALERPAARAGERELHCSPPSTATASGCM